MSRTVRSSSLPLACLLGLLLAVSAFAAPQKNAASSSSARKLLLGSSTTGTISRRELQAQTLAQIVTTLLDGGKNSACVVNGTAPVYHLLAGRGPTTKGLGGFVQISQGEAATFVAAGPFGGYNGVWFYTLGSNENWSPQPGTTVTKLRSGGFYGGAQKTARGNIIILLTTTKDSFTYTQTRLSQANTNLAAIGY